ncbi:MAG: 8-oxoguanine deaminase [Chloroflexi bacterium]|nr:8-oxoguanine deaminase [Chloroflexota bacterium]
MTTIVLRHADVLVTMDPARREIQNGGMIIRDGVIEAVAPTNELPTVMEAHVIDMSGHIVLPGLVNTHHHLYQTLTRAVPAAQNATLFNWLKTLYPIWARLTPEAVYVSALTGLAELLLSGCTTASDHLYLFPNGSELDDEIRAAKEIGIRFHASRGSMSLGESKGGLPPDSVVEDEDEILKDTQRLIQTYHDSMHGAMLRIVVAPCSPFSVTPELMKQSSALAREYGVTMHTHLAETLDEENFCLEKFGHRPVDYMETLRWVGPDVWYAHAVHVNDSEIRLMSQTGCGAAHCPSSNMRLASGIAPVKKYRAAGVKVGLGVDGSASNDGSHLLGEARQAMLLARLALTPRPPLPSAHAKRERSEAKSKDAPTGEGEWMTAREALEIATLGGAKVLGRDDIGSLAKGMCADLFAIDLNRLDYAGAAVHDPVASVLFCAPQKADYVMVNGKWVVKEGQLTTVDLGPVVEKHNGIAKELVDG